jgi:hypothetical protein
VVRMARADAVGLVSFPNKVALYRPQTKNGLAKRARQFIQSGVGCMAFDLVFVGHVKVDQLAGPTAPAVREDSRVALSGAAA